MTIDITENIRRHGFKRLLLAVSGGLDSICLAHYFIKNCEVLGIEWLGIAHVHHGLREGTADRDAAFVEEFAKSHGVAFFLKRLDGEALKAAEGSLEENARNARYKALVEVIKDIVTLEACKADRVHGSYRSRSSLQDDENTGSFDFAQDDEAKDDPGTRAGMTIANGNTIVSNIAIVTAHHAGDQSETMYMRLRRGTTLAGLRGIQEVRAMSDEHFAKGDPGTGSEMTSLVYLYRPFLNVTRAELLAYAQENNLTWCEDESNTNMKFARNKIRHIFLPRLEENCPGATQQLCRIAGIADKVYAEIVKKCNKLFNVTLEVCKADRVHGSYRSRSSLQDDEAKGNPRTHSTGSEQAPSGMTCLKLDKKKLNKILAAHKDADLSELFRLWLSEKGFRFPIGFFYAPKEPAHVKIPVHAVYRKRSIVKIRNTVRICEFKDALTASKFVSCEMNEKDYNEST